MQHTGGRVVVGLVGLAIVACGIVLVVEGARDQPFGELLMLLAALGLLIFGVYGLCEARWRKV